MLRRSKEEMEKKGVDAMRSFEAIMTVVDRHRPFEPSDFIKEYFIADLVIALLITINFMGAPVQPKQNKTENKQNSAAVAKQYQNQMNCLNYFTGMQKVRDA